MGGSILLYAISIGEMNRNSGRPRRRLEGKKKGGRKKEREEGSTVNLLHNRIFL